MQAFEPKTLTIAELFGNQDSLYKIPRYQRPYKWEGNTEMEKRKKRTERLKKNNQNAKTRAIPSSAIFQN